jgi:anaerobic selenocysteine-containing dehydrogenase
MERPLLTTFEDAANVVIGGVRAVPPEFERRMDYDFWRGLGIRLGQENEWPWVVYEDVMAYRLERIGITSQQFAERPWVIGELEFEKHKKVMPETGKLHGFATPSRRVEIYASTFEELGYDPLPRYQEPAESPLSAPELAKEYPLILMSGGRFVPMFHSEHRVPGIGTREMWPWPTMLIHTDTARRLGIRDGDWCWIETKRGRIRQKAKLTFSIDPKVVNVQASWWYPEMPAEEPFLHGVWESNANVLTLDDPETLDPICGNWTNRGLMCKVYPTGGPK